MKGLVRPHRAVPLRYQPLVGSSAVGINCEGRPSLDLTLVRLRLVSKLDLGTCSGLWYLFSVDCVQRVQSGHVCNRWTVINVAGLTQWSICESSVRVNKLCCLIMLHVFLIDQMRSTYQMITNTNFMISEDTIVRHGLPQCNSPEMHNRYCNASR